MRKRRIGRKCAPRVASLNMVGAMQPVPENMGNHLLVFKVTDLRTLQRHQPFVLFDTSARRTVVDDLDEDAVTRVYIHTS
jgi:hypothetical protein